MLRRAASEQLSGNLQAAYRTAVKSVCIDRGHVVDAASSLKGDRLGETMMELGRISYDEFALASREMRSRGQKFGQAIVAAGFISEKELGHQLSLQIARIVQSLNDRPNRSIVVSRKRRGIPLRGTRRSAVFREEGEFADSLGSSGRASKHERHCPHLARHSFGQHSVAPTPMLSYPC